MKIKVLNQAIGILILVSIIFSLTGALAFPGHSRTTETPDITGFGTGGNFTQNGTMVILVYDDQLGFPHELTNGALYHYNTIYIQYVQGLGSYTAHITLDQYITVMRNVTVHGSNNTTYETVEPVKVNQQFSNVTLFPGNP